MPNHIISKSFEILKDADGWGPLCSETVEYLQDLVASIR